MAGNYDTYKKLRTDQIPNGTFTDTSIQLGAGKCYGVQWVYSARAMCCHHCANNGGCVCQACGRCCLWTVPTNVTNVTFEIWSGGGGGTGNNCCGCCSDTIGGAGGNYAVKTITTRPGCQYRVCAGGSWPCSKAHTCTAGQGCKSYVTGYNLSNFCTVGGCGGINCQSDGFNPGENSSQCANCNICGIYGADFGIQGTVGSKFQGGYHHCMHKTSFSGHAPLIGKIVATGVGDATCQCGCYVNWPAGGGQPGVTGCYGTDAQMCCGGGSGQGGSGIVKITYG
jgi:hypothetical protein